MWPGDPESLMAAQQELSRAEPEPWTPPARELLVGACWVCFPRGLSGPGSRGDPAWAAAVVMSGSGVVARRVVEGAAGAPYRPGLLALRTGPVLEEVVRGLRAAPDVLVLDATGRDHPRRAGLALHLGAVLDLPTVGVTHRPLLGEGLWPDDQRGATSDLRIGHEVVACWLCPRRGTRPLVVHPGWRVHLPTAVELVAGTLRARRTPEPLRWARQLAREARVAAEPVR